MKTRVMIMAGGTGGHIYPALAVAEKLQAKGCQIFWMGTPKGLEATIIPKTTIPIYWISISGLRGKGFLSLFMAPFKLTIALIQAMRILLKIKPAVVLGMGGFVTGPGGLVSRLFRIPLVIHEQNAIAGLTNRWLSKIATRVLEAFPQSFLNIKATLTGNPVRQNITNILPPEKRISEPGALRILIIGGSLGAVILNEMLPAAVAKIDIHKRPKLWHQTGIKNIEHAKFQYQQAHIDAELAPFIENMNEAYEWADLVICRAGALTISELMNVGMASILIPYPHAVDDHQTHNARYLVNHQAAIMIPQAQLSPSIMADLICDLADHREQVVAMANRARACAKPMAADQVADICLELA